jgi:hypothetical protein
MYALKLVLVNLVSVLVNLVSVLVNLVLVLGFDFLSSPLPSHGPPPPSESELR